MKLVRHNSTANVTMLFRLSGCAVEFGRKPSRFSIVGSNKLLIELSTSTTWILWDDMAVYYFDMELLTSNQILLTTNDMYGFMYSIKMRVLMNKECRCNSSVAIG
jgi:hypothetical protein